MGLIKDALLSLDLLRARMLWFFHRRAGIGFPFPQLRPMYCHTMWVYLFSADYRECRRHKGFSRNRLASNNQGAGEPLLRTLLGGSVRHSSHFLLRRSHNRHTSGEKASQEPYEPVQQNRCSQEIYMLHRWCVNFVLFCILKPGGIGLNDAPLGVSTLTINVNHARPIFDLRSFISLIKGSF